MCLDTITKRYKRASNKEVVAYKVFWSLGDGRLGFQFCAWENAYLVPTGRWLKAERVTVFPDLAGEYQSGFHCFASRAGAEGYSFGFVKVARVRVRGVETVGEDCCGAKVLVAREMYVPKQRKPRKRGN